MAQTKRKRRKKHRGTQAGIVERPHPRSGRAHSSSRTEIRQTARERRQARLDKPPTWSGAMNRAASAAIVFGALVILLFHEKPAAGVTLAAFMFVLYIPMSYYTDKLIYNRRQAQKAKGS